MPPKRKKGDDEDSEVEFAPSASEVSEFSEGEDFKQPSKPSTPKARSKKKVKALAEDKEDSFTGESGKGERCHQCRNPPTNGAEVIHCTDLRRHDATGKILKNPRRCEAGFCSRCLTNRYDEPITPEKRIAWKCPVCRLICNCARCRRKKGLAPTGQLLARAKELGVDSAQAALALSPAKPGIGEIRQPEAGTSTDKTAQPVKRPPHQLRERIPRPDGVPLHLPDDAPSIYDCLHLREFIYRFKDLCFDLGPHAQGSRGTHKALAELDDLVGVWSTESAPRYVLRGLLRLIQRENSHFGSPLRRLYDRAQVEKAEKETHTQSRWGDRCWRTAKPIVDGDTIHQLQLPNGDLGEALSPMEFVEDEGGATTGDESMEVEELVDQSKQAELMARLPTPAEKVRILTGLAELAMKGEVVRTELQDGVDIAIAYRASITKAKKDASEAKSALKQELADGKLNLLGPEAIQDIEQRIADKDYEARLEMARLYVDSTSKRTRFRPLFSADGIDYYLPNTYSSAVPFADEGEIPSCSNAVLAHVAEQGQSGWSVFQRAPQIRLLANWIDGEIKHHQFQIAKAAKAEAAAAEAAAAAAASSAEGAASLVAPETVPNPATDGVNGHTFLPDGINGVLTFGAEGESTNANASAPTPLSVVQVSAPAFTIDPIAAFEPEEKPALTSTSNPLQDVATHVDQIEAPANQASPSEPKAEIDSKDALSSTESTAHITSVEAVQPLRAFADFVEFKLEIEPPFREQNRAKHWRNRAVQYEEVDELEEEETREEEMKDELEDD